MQPHMSLAVSKTCSKCNAEKNLQEYYTCKRSPDGKRSVCKTCFLAIEAARRAENIEHRRAIVRKSYYANLDAERERGRKRSKDERAKRRDDLRNWRAANLEHARKRDREWRRSNPEKALASYKKWRAKNPEKVVEFTQRANAKRLATVRGRLDNNIRSGVHRGIAEGTKANRSAYRLIGFTREELITHIERQFLKGMSWNNYGDWHIDHIVPLSAFDYSSPDDEEFRAAWSLTNLRPLWKAENLSKNAKRAHLL